MSVTQTTRFNIYRWSSGADSFTRSQLDSSHAQIEALASGFLQGTTRPPASTQYLGFIFYNTATQALSYCNGTQWIGLNSFGTPSTQLLDDNASDGIAIDVARSDHKHGFPGFGPPVDISTSNQTGVSDTLARSDHQHKLADLIISGGAIQDDSIDTPAIVDGAVTQPKLAPNSVGSAQIITGAVGNSELGANSVTSNKIANSTIVGADIAANTITSDKIVSIDASKITGTVSSSPNIDASQVVSGTLSTLRIPNLAASKITSGAFSTARIPSLDASKITSGTININRIPNFAATKITSGDLPYLRGPERIKTTFAGVERTSRIYINTNGPSGGSAYDVWIEY